MKKPLLVSLMCLALSAPMTAQAGLDDFLSNLNVEARLDLGDFSVRVSNQFGVSVEQVRTVLKTVSQPADAFMVFQMKEMAQQPVEKVMAVYSSQRDKGWGVMAKELGIKPGSKEFHALKNGDLKLAGGKGPTEATGGGDRPGKGHGKGKGKGHD